MNLEVIFGEKTILQIVVVRSVSTIDEVGWCRLNGIAANTYSKLHLKLHYRNLYVG